MYGMVVWSIKENKWTKVNTCNVIVRLKNYDVLYVCLILQNKISPDTLNLYYLLIVDLGFLLLHF